MKLNNIRSLFRDYKWKSLFFKYFKIVLCLVLIPIIVLYGAVLFYQNNMYLKNQSATITETTNRISYQFDNILNNLSMIQQWISTDSSVIDYLSKNTDIVTADHTTISRIKNQFNTYINSQSNYIDSMYLYSSKNNYVLSSKYSSSAIDTFYDTSWYDFITDKNSVGNIVYSKTKYPGTIPDVLSVIYPIYQGSTQSGIIVFNLDIVDFFDKSLIDGEHNAFILDAKKNIIYSHNNLYNDIIQKESPNLNVANTPLNGSNISISIAALYKKFNDNSTFLWIMILFLLLCVVSSVLLALYISSIFYESIAKIVTNVQTMSAGQQLRDEDCAEMLMINQNMLTMITKSEQIETELSSKVTELKKAQTIAMQTQINPHFIFNTLNSMNVLALTNQSSETLSTMIVLLSDILSEALDTRKMLVTLHYELIYTKKYIDILKIRENNNFQIIWNVPVELSDCTVIKFCIQPLIENAFEHGLKLKPITDNRTIIIKIEEKNNVVFINVTDNGPCIPIEKINIINQELDLGELPESKNIGLKNTNIRIKLIFGDDYGCHLFFNPDGTTAQLRFPSQKNKFK